MLIQLYCTHCVDACVVRVACRCVLTFVGRRRVGVGNVGELWLELRRLGKAVRPGRVTRSGAIRLVPFVWVRVITIRLVAGPLCYADFSKCQVWLSASLCGAPK